VGFDFLGCTIRQYPVGKYVARKLYATLIKPSKKAIERHYRALAAPIERMQAAPIDEVRRTLNPKIVGWSNYFRTQVSKKAFHRLDDLLWHKMLGWAKRKHNKKSTTWILEKYFKPYGKCQHHRIMGKTYILKWHDETNITRHIPLRVILYRTFFCLITASATCGHAA
jgi:RNA-directed DNA polymerase